MMESSFSSADLESDLSRASLSVINAQQMPVNATLIVVRPKYSETEIDTNPHPPRPERRNKKKVVHPPSPSLSSENSIEEMDIGDASERVISQSSESLEVEDNEKDCEAEHEDSSCEDLSASFASLTPVQIDNIIDCQSDMIQFVLRPPPENAVVKCQLSKTNSVDKTLLFTSFIFSLEVPNSDDSSKANLLTLMVANPNRNPKRFAHTIFLDCKFNSTIVGHLKSGIVGKRFNIYSANCSSAENTGDFGSFDFDSRINDASTDVKSFDHLGAVFYKSSKFGSKKPRQIEFILPKWNAVKETYTCDSQLPMRRKQSDVMNSETFTRLENEDPTFNKEEKQYSLNFGGRVKVTSVKNCAMTMSVGDHKKRVFQFGKCKNHYIVDFTYPLCPLQAFAIGISICQRKFGME